MPNINEMMPSKYLKISDVPDPVIVTVAGVKQVNIAQEDKEPEYKWGIKFKEFQKPMILNKTNMTVAALVFKSNQTEDWIGKEIILFNDESVSYAGQVTGGLRFRGQDKAPARVAQNADAPPADFEAFKDDVPW